MTVLPDADRTLRAQRPSMRSADSRVMRTRTALAIAVCLISACATNPVTGKRQFSLMSEAQEIQIGQQQDAEVRREMGVYGDRALQQYVSTVGLKLAHVSERPNLPWHFTVVDVPAINAFALPGGYIYITRGILAFLDNEAQLAGVLGHEIGHVTARHAAQQYSRATGAELGLILGTILLPETRPFAQLGEASLGLLFLKYGRDDELQADSLGVKYAARAGWDPEGVPQMLTTLGRMEEASDNRGVPNWLSTHPNPENRVEKVRVAVAEAERTGVRGGEAGRSAESLGLQREEYLRRIDGIVHGDNPDQGVVRGASFLHAGLRFALEFPQDWAVTNAPTQVVARSPRENTLMLLQLVQQPVGRTLEEVALRSMANAGFRAASGGRTSLNGLDAFVGTYEGSLQNVGRVVVRAAHVAHERNIFLIAGIAPPATYDRDEPAFTRSIASFRPLTRAEAEAIRPNRIDLYTARAGDTWQALAERNGGVAKASTLAIMNGHAVNDQPRPGERLKIVVGG